MEAEGTDQIKPEDDEEEERNALWKVPSHDEAFDEVNDDHTWDLWHWGSTLADRASECYCVFGLSLAWKATVCISSSRTVHTAL